MATQEEIVSASPIQMVLYMFLVSNAVVRNKMNILSAGVHCLEMRNSGYFHT